MASSTGRPAGEALPAPSPGQSYWDVEIYQISPVYRKAGGEGFVLEVLTYNTKHPDTAIRWNGKDLPIVHTGYYIDGRGVSYDVQVSAEDIAVPGVADVTVFVPDGKGGGMESLPRQFYITEGNIPILVKLLRPSSLLKTSDGENLEFWGCNLVDKNDGHKNTKTVIVVNGKELDGLTTAWGDFYDYFLTWLAPKNFTGVDTLEFRLRNIIDGVVYDSDPVTIRVWEENPVPVTSFILQYNQYPVSERCPLRILGKDFAQAGAVDIEWNGTLAERDWFRSNTYSFAGEIQIWELPPDLCRDPGIATIRVVNNGPGGGTSEAKEFRILAVPPRPAIESLKPAFAVAGSEGFVLTVRGRDFYGIGGDGKCSVIRWEGEALPTTYVSSRELTAEISKSRLSEAGTFPVTVYTPGGGESEPVSFEVRREYPVPTVTKLEPSSTKAGGPQFALKVEGTGFVGALGSAKGSVVRWNGVDRQTRYVSATALAASIPATDISKPGTATVTVKNGEEKVSNGAVFTIEKSLPDEVPTPVVTGISPSSADAGDPETTLSVTGRDFSGDARVLWDGKERKTTRVRSGTELSAVLPASDLAVPGRHLVTVYNPGTAGQSGKTSNGMNFTVRRKGGEQAIIPTLNEWGMIVLMVLVVGASVVRMRRREGNR